MRRPTKAAGVFVLRKFLDTNSIPGRYFGFHRSLKEEKVPTLMEKQGKEWDAFVSHAVEDQESFVRHLSRMLTRLGLSVWYAETALRVGDSLSASISRGLACSRYLNRRHQPALHHKAVDKIGS